MRRAVTFAITGATSELVSGPEVPLPDQLHAFKSAIRAGSFGKAEALEVWISCGTIKRTKFKPVQPVTRKKSENEK